MEVTAAASVVTIIKLEDGIITRTVGKGIPDASNFRTSMVQEVFLPHDRFVYPHNVSTYLLKSVAEAVQRWHSRNTETKTKRQLDRFANTHLSFSSHIQQPNNQTNKSQP
jgi:hypothetical protein